MNVPKSTPAIAMYGELGRLPLYVKRKERLIKYWIKIINDRDSIAFTVYEVLCKDADEGKCNWASKVRNVLFNLGFPRFWLDQNEIYNEINFNTIKLRLHDQYIQEWQEAINSTQKLIYYRNFKITLEFEKYLYCLPSRYRNIVSQFRCGILKLNIELGRHCNIPREARYCKICNLCMIEDEYHFLLICPAYRNIRMEYLPLYYNHWPNLNKMYNILKAKTNYLLKKLALYLYNAWNYRKSILQETT